MNNYNLFDNIPKYPLGTINTNVIYNYIIENNINIRKSFKDKLGTVKDYVYNKSKHSSLNLGLNMIDTQNIHSLLFNNYHILNESEWNYENIKLLKLLKNNNYDINDEIKQFYLKDYRFTNEILFFNVRSFLIKNNDFTKSNIEYIYKLLLPPFGFLKKITNNNKNINLDNWYSSNLKIDTIKFKCDANDHNVYSFDNYENNPYPTLKDINNLQSRVTSYLDYESNTDISNIKKDNHDGLVFTYKHQLLEDLITPLSSYSIYNYTYIDGLGGRYFFTKDDFYFDNKQGEFIIYNLNNNLSKCIFGMNDKLSKIYNYKIDERKRIIINPDTKLPPISLSFFRINQSNKIYYPNAVPLLNHKNYKLNIIVSKDNNKVYNKNFNPNIYSLFLDYNNYEEIKPIITNNDILDNFDFRLFSKKINTNKKIGEDLKLYDTEFGESVIINKIDIVNNIEKLKKWFKNISFDDYSSKKFRNIQDINNKFVNNYEKYNLEKVYNEISTNFIIWKGHSNRISKDISYSFILKDKNQQFNHNSFINFDICENMPIFKDKQDLIINFTNNIYFINESLTSNFKTFNDIFSDKYLNDNIDDDFINTWNINVSENKFSIFDKNGTIINDSYSNWTYDNIIRINDTVKFKNGFDSYLATVGIYNNNHNYGINDYICLDISKILIDSNTLESFNELKHNKNNIEIFYDDNFNNIRKSINTNIITNTNIKGYKNIYNTDIIKFNGDISNFNEETIFYFDNDDISGWFKNTYVNKKFGLRNTYNNDINVKYYYDHNYDERIFKNYNETKYINILDGLEFYNNNGQITKIKIDTNDNYRVLIYNSDILNITPFLNYKLYKYKPSDQELNDFSNNNITYSSDNYNKNNYIILFKDNNYYFRQNNFKNKIYRDLTINSINHVHLTDNINIKIYHDDNLIEDINKDNILNFS